MELKPDFYYSEDHEWINATPDEAAGKTVRVGITHVAADRLGEVVFAELPQVGDTVTAGETCGEIESTKSVSDLFSPIDGTVLEVNQAVVDALPAHLGRGAVTSAVRFAAVTEDEIRGGLVTLWQAMQDCVAHGLAGEGTLPGGLKVVRRAPGLHRRLQAEGAAYIAMALDPEIRRIVLLDGPAFLGDPSRWPSQNACLEVQQRLAIGRREGIRIGPEAAQRLRVGFHQRGSAAPFPVTEMQLPHIGLKVQRQ